jgi:hypothetical protein
VLFGGHDHVLRTAGLSYADYAHQGYGQLMAAAMLTLAVIAAARRGNMPALAAAEKTQRAAAAALFSLAANYPQFGTSKAFKALRERASTLDARVDDRRERYNNAVSVLNFRCKAFPYSLVARSMGLRPSAFLS